MSNRMWGGRVALMATLVLSGACATVPAKPSSADAAIYEVTFQGTWTKATHPAEYPEGSSLDLGAAHFSGVIGAPHSAGYSLFKEGAQASPGLMTLSHTGGHSPLDAELKAAAAAGNAGEMFETGVFIDVNAPQSARFEVSDRFPLVSLAAMVAPSPDWFVGVNDVDLKENGKWVDAKTIQAYAWDSGTYDGMTYKAPEKATSPHEPVARNTAPPFKQGTAVATITFKRVQ